MNEKNAVVPHFTPLVTGTKEAGTGTYSIQTGFYTQTKDQAYVVLTVAWTAHTGTGGLLISNLPLKVQAFNPNCRSLAIVYTSGIVWSGAATDVVGEFQPNSYNCLLLGERSSGAKVPINLGASGQVQLSGWYFI